MNLNIIPFIDIQTALTAADATDCETDKFNTHFHTHAEIAAVIPEPEDTPTKHVFPDLTTSHFSHWIDLIATSQGFHDWHEFIIPNSLVQELLDANTVWALTGKTISDDAMEDLLARFPKRTSRGIETQTVFDGQKEWFLRLDFCSTKDARDMGGKKYGSSIRTAEDALRRICASKRATRALEDILLNKAPGRARLFFIPHNKHMDTSREFRVFCPPVWTLSLLSKKHHGKIMPSLHTSNEQTERDVLTENLAAPCSSKHLEKHETHSTSPHPSNLNQHNNKKHSPARITAISQYRYHAPYPYHHHDASSTATYAYEHALALTRAAQSIHAQILTHAAADPHVLEKLHSEGFVFDIFDASSSLMSGNGTEMQLLELNPFGAMSGCGSCLFHWIEDAAVLYGAREEVEVEVRFTL